MKNLLAYTPEPFDNLEFEAWERNALSGAGEMEDEARRAGKRRLRYVQKRPLGYSALPGRPKYPVKPRPRRRPPFLRPLPGGSAASSGPPAPAEDCRCPGQDGIRWVQETLNRALGLRLLADGIMNRETRSAVRIFQERKGLPVTGLVGPDTEEALKAEGRQAAAKPEPPEGEWEMPHSASCSCASCCGNETGELVFEAEPFMEGAEFEELEANPSILSLLDRIRAAPKTYISPRTNTKRRIVDGYERVEPRGDIWCRQAGLNLDEGALARMVASEAGRMPPQYMLAVIEATLNEARAKNISAFQRITMQGIKLRGGAMAKSAGYFGRQSGRWCASIQDPTFQHLEAVRVALSASARLVTRDGRRWVDGKVMDGGLQAEKKLKYNAVTIVEKWGAEGWEWIGPVYEPDGQTLLIDPYRLMVFRFVGRGKANIRLGVEAMREGRRRWKVKVG